MTRTKSKMHNSCRRLESYQSCSKDNNLQFQHQKFIRLSKLHYQTNQYYLKMTRHSKMIITSNLLVKLCFCSNQFCNFFYHYWPLNSRISTKLSKSRLANLIKICFSPFPQLLITHIWTFVQPIKFAEK